MPKTRWPSQLRLQDRSVSSAHGLSRLQCSQPMYKPTQHTRFDRPGCYDVDPDTALCGFQSGCFGQPFDPVLAGDVERCAGATNSAKGGGDIHDASFLLLKHDSQFVLHAQQSSKDIRFEHSGVAFHGLINDRPGLPFGSGAVDRDAQAAEMYYGSIHESANFIIVPYVRLDEQSVGAEFAKLVG